MYKVFCDFDATITLYDVGDQFLTKFGRPEALTIWSQFGEGSMSAEDCLRFACSTVEGADHQDAHELFRSQRLRAGFPQFVEFCETQQIPIRIASDGFSGYIRPILEHHDLELPFHANLIELTEEGSLAVSFQNGREGCFACASCKCAHLIANSEDEDTIVYVGDGYSDRCPVKIADVVFARDQLLRLCSEDGIPHHPFEDFFEVQAILKNYLTDRPKYRREQAHRNRKRLVMTE
jgi:2,3-diketo-5-methylthio-1-phosphopentane phosphatase